jgi:hypothetical protein
MPQPEPFIPPGHTGGDTPEDRLRRVDIREAVTPCRVSQKGQEPAVWLPLCMAPLWVCVPIVGCLVAGLFR